MRTICLLAVTLLLSSPAMAAKGEVCKTAAAVVPETLSNDAVFECPNPGKLTIPQMYERGWRLVSLFSQMAHQPADAPVMKVQWVAVIEKLD